MPPLNGGRIGVAVLMVRSEPLPQQVVRLVFRTYTEGKRAMYVEQIMSREVDTAAENMKVSHAAQLMRERDRRFLPVALRRYFLPRRS